MNKQELTIVALLSALLIGWLFVYGKRPPPPPQDAAPPGVESAQEDEPAALSAGTADQSHDEPVAAPDEADSEVAVEDLPPEATAAITNDLVKLVLSSRSGGIKLAELSAYRATIEEDSGPVFLDFSGQHALSLSGIPGLGVGHFEVMSDGESGTVRRSTSSGLAFERSIRFANGYRLEVEDTFVNGGSEAIKLPPHAISSGPMQMIQTQSKMRGIFYLGLDTLAAEGNIRVEHWGKKLNEFFGAKGGMLSCGRPDMRGKPFEAKRELTTAIDWVAAKNKFFVVIVAPEETALGCDLHVTRDRSLTNMLELTAVSAELHVQGATLQPGESHSRKLSYYVGPKKYSELKKLGKYQGEVMQFGWWDWFRWICRTMLGALNFFNDYVPGGYGVAIILVTVIIRILFWPLTHKSTDSMKRMQKIQPLVTEIREKYKSNPQKMQQETMALYKLHNVNPMASCLPMVAQIPVFIALFIVLRSAVELRFADFLWIRDLSEPEGLFQGMIPIIGSLNVLPLLMTAVTVVQQRLTPSAGDPAQQKMMMMMPIIFLFLFYKMASALVLYWTVSQGLALLQLGLQKRYGKDNDPVVKEEGAKKPDLIAKPMNKTTPGRKKKKKR